VAGASLKEIMNRTAIVVPVARSRERGLAEVVRCLAEIPDLEDCRDAEVDAEMLVLLRAAETRLRHLRRQVEDRLADAELRPCPRCGTSLTGRKDRQFCSDRCRKSAHRQRAAVKVAAAAGAALAASSGQAVVARAPNPPVSVASLYRNVAPLRRPTEVPAEDRDMPEPDGAYALDYVTYAGTAPVFVNVTGRPRWNTAGAATTMKWPTPRPDLPRPHFGWETFE
jgi:predicted nucleic acid-binding Zn ribbon protein